MKICFSSIFGLSMAAFISFGQAPPNLPADKKVTEQYNLGVRYEKGEGVPKDLGKAVELYKKAADQGYAAAQNHLGELYDFGVGVPQDFGKAVELYKKAADQGNQRAMVNLLRLSGDLD